MWNGFKITVQVQIHILGGTWVLSIEMIDNESQSTGCKYCM